MKAGAKPTSWNLPVLLVVSHLNEARGHGEILLNYKIDVEWGMCIRSDASRILLTNPCLIRERRSAAKPVTGLTVLRSNYFRYRCARQTVFIDTAIDDVEIRFNESYDINLTGIPMNFFIKALNDVCLQYVIPSYNYECSDIRR